jgi:tripartite-type tricarboxylate transporter receptor subunit TctC
MIHLVPRRFFMSVMVAAMCSASAFAQQYPVKPVRLIVPFAPGGTSDFVARLVAVKLTEALKQSVYVENKPGADARIGIDFVAKAPADGYTLLLGHGGAMTVNPALYPNLPYDVLRDFAPIGMLTESGLLLVTAATSEYKTVADLIKAGKADSAKLSYSTGGIGSTAHTTSELFNYQAGVKALHIPFTGAGPATVAAVSGEVSYTFTGQATGWPLVNAGKLRALGVTSAQRLAEHPEVPTIAESGAAGFNTYDWNFLLAPAGTPDAIVKKLNAELRQILNDPTTKAQMAKLGVVGQPGSPEQLTARIRTELVKWARVVKETNIKAQ